ncbi:hypothetical protein CXB51_013653 [Gossypium anomalum]|uniref:Uncharacterized protein n=1 Tax=Gossypium anomalum TaxID=47600 RepID=A0A8J5Z326_9ROSI|nr:hypothetical protein CXB51_013653 [Gossypium anomalum]
MENVEISVDDSRQMRITKWERGDRVGLWWLEIRLGMTITGGGGMGDERNSIEGRIRGTKLMNSCLSPNHLGIQGNIYNDCCQLDIQFYGACAMIQGLCASENVICMSLAVSQMSIFKYEYRDGNGFVVEVKRFNNLLIDKNEYPTILKSKLHQARAAIALFRALTVKLKGSFVQVKNQGLQSDPMFNVPPVLEQGELDAGIFVVSTTQKMSFYCWKFNGFYSNFVHWHSIRFDNPSKTPTLDYLGSKLFKSSSIVYACCNPYMPEESVVLLENGALFLFDLTYYLNCQKLNDYVKGSKLRFYGMIRVVHNKCNVICLAKIEMLSPYDVVDEDQFLVFPRVGADGFQFVLALISLFLLCEVHKPRFLHNIGIILELICCYKNFKVLQTLFSRDILKLMCESDEFGGLILIRLMFSGKNKAQRYCASCDLVQNFDIAHKEPLFNFEDNLLYSSSDDEYEFPKRFKYLNLDYLRGYLNDNLAEGLDDGLQIWLIQLVDVPFDDIAMPLEFSVALGLSQLPPFLLGKLSCCNTLWSHKIQLDDSLVGHVLPLAILLTLHEFCNCCPNSEKMCGFSLNTEFGFRFNVVMRVVAEIVVLDSNLLSSDRTFSLVDDRDEKWVNSQWPKQFLLYHPVAGESHGNRIYNNMKFTTMSPKVHKVTDPNDTMDSVGLQLFDDLYPIELKFDVLVITLC